jgi:hypothetical protein
VNDIPSKRLALRRASPCGTVGRLSRGLAQGGLQRAGDTSDTGAGRPSLKRAGLYRVGQVASCAGTCLTLNPHPNIASTVGNWPFCSSLADISGNGLDMTMLTGSAAYETIGRIKGFTLTSGSTLLAAPVSAFLQFTGDYTVECVMIPRATYAQQMWICANNTGFAQSKLYGSAIDAGTRVEYCDRNINDQFLGSPGTPILWATYKDPGLPIHFAQRRSGTLLEVFVNGVKLSPNISSIAGMSAVGNERLYLGGAGYGGTGSTFNGSIGALRFLNVARSDAGIAADAAAAALVTV